MDKNPAYPAAVRALKAEGTLLNRVRLRQCRYLNNVVEQDHRTVKKRVWLAKGYDSFRSAWRTLQGNRNDAHDQQGKSSVAGQGRCCRPSLLSCESVRDHCLKPAAISPLPLGQLAFTSTENLAMESAGLYPGNRRSAGKDKGGRTTRGNRWLRATLRNVRGQQQPKRNRVADISSTLSFYCPRAWAVQEELQSVRDFQRQFVDAPPIWSLEAYRLLATTYKAFGIGERFEATNRGCDLMEKRFQWAKTQLLAAVGVLTYFLDKLKLFDWIVKKMPWGG